jgi:hypothetical protein
LSVDEFDACKDFGANQRRNSSLATYWNFRVAAALLTLLGVATASAQDQIGFRIDLPIIWNNKVGVEAWILLISSGN